MSWTSTIGIVGGLGPHAHIEFERLLLRAAEEVTGRAMRDQDYPPWVLISIPQTPDRTEALSGGPSPVDDLARAVRRLRTEAATPSADFAVIVCNAAHAWLAELRRRVELPILDMPGEALRVAVTLASEGTSIGLLGTSATLDSGIYPEALERLGHRPRIITLYDVKHEGHDGARLHEDLVMSPIYGPMKDGQRVGGGIKSGRLGPTSDGVDPGAQLRRAVELLGRAGASVVITACTEIPLALGRVPVEGIPLIDPMQVAATESIAIASGSRPLP